MRVFVAGASGAIGTRLIPLLMSAGHQVTGTTRRPDRADALRAAGATAAVVDALEPKQLIAAVERARRHHSPADRDPEPLRPATVGRRVRRDQPASD